MKCEMRWIELDTKTDRVGDAERWSRRYRWQELEMKMDRVGQSGRYRWFFELKGMILASGPCLDGQRRRCNVSKSG